MWKMLCCSKCHRSQKSWCMLNPKKSFLPLLSRDDRVRISVLRDTGEFAPTRKYHFFQNPEGQPRIPECVRHGNALEASEGDRCRRSGWMVVYSAITWF